VSVMLAGHCGGYQSPRLLSKVGWQYGEWLHVVSDVSRGEGGGRCEEQVCWMFRR
jgi:hypothetical protein